MAKKKERGRPAKPYPRIPDTYENIIKTLVRPVKKESKSGSSEVKAHGDGRTAGQLH